MGASRLMSAILILFNILHVAIALGLTTASIWMFVQIVSVTNIRNPSQVATDFNVYWPQALPWVFVLAAVLSLFVSCCGFIGAGKRIDGLVRVYMTFEVLSILALVLAAALALVYGTDPQHTDTYVNDVFSSAFSNVKTSYDNDPTIVEAFGQVEKSLHCCGSNGPEDYINLKRNIPESCCDKVFKGCSSLTGITTQKIGCAEVAAAHAKFYFKALAYVSILAAVIGLANVFIAFVLSRTLNKKSRDVPQDPETKKVLL